MITDVWLGALLATALALALTVTLALTVLAWLWSKLRRFKKLWIEQEKGIRFGGELRAPPAGGKFMRWLTRTE